MAKKWVVLTGIVLISLLSIIVWIVWQKIAQVSPHYRADNFIFIGEATFAGRVRENRPQGKILKNVRVALYKDGREITSVMTNKQGIFTFKNLPEGIYDLVFIHPDYFPKKLADVHIEAKSQTIPPDARAVILVPLTVEHVPHQVIVAFKDNTEEAKRKALLQELKVKPLESLLKHSVLVEGSPEESVQEIIKKFLESPLVKYAEVNMIARVDKFK